MIPKINSLMNVLMLNSMKTKRTMSALSVISVMLSPPIDNNVFPITDHAHILIPPTVLSMKKLSDMKKFKLNVLMKDQPAAV